MGLRVCYSERIEDLARELKKGLLAERSEADAFDFSQVVVPNANIAKWLRIRAFADEPSLCAGMEFPFIEQALFRAMNEALEPSSRAELLPMNAYANGIMGILLGERSPALAPFYRYVAPGEDIGRDESRTEREGMDSRKAWQLCVKLADLMDQYEVRRTDIIANWLRGVGMKGGAYADATEAAEAELARRLFGAGGVFPPDGKRLSLRQLYERVLDARHQAPSTRHQAPGTRHQAPTYRFFGLSTLTPLQVRILRWLATRAEVEVYHNNVCLEYWGDIETREESRRLREKCRMADDDSDFKIENPLLSQWGVAGRETLRLLARLEEEGDEDVRFEWRDVSTEREEPSSILGAVQYGICRRTGEVGRMAQDATLQAVAAPGLRREVETVHNAILDLVVRGDSGDFSDVAVLVTDMGRYRPMIEAVFNSRGVVPYGLIDTSASEDSDCLAAFQALAAIAEKGLGRATLFAALENPCVQRSLGFGMDDVRGWKDLTEEIGAFEGFDAVGEYANFSWDAALARLRLGFVTDDSPDCPVCQCSEDNALKFSEIVETLHREISPLGGLAHTCAEWADVLRSTISRFIDTGDDAGEESVRRAISETLGSLRNIPGEHRLEFVAAAVNEFAGGMKSGRSGYLTGGVTVASLQPMRPVPFRNIFVLGMGEGDFPGRESSTTLDMRGAKRGLGDASTPTLNRYLFLETLMAARDRLVVSYRSQDTQKDAELFPSGLVSELEKFIEDAILDGGAKFREVPVPLLERGEPGDCPLANPVGEIKREGYWAGIIPTYSSDVRRLAMRLAKGERREDVCGEGKPGTDDGETAAEELAAFMNDPLQAVLQYRFGISKDYIGGDDDETPLELPDNGLCKWRFDETVLKSLEDGNADEAEELARTYDDFAAHGMLPERSGFFGAYSFKRVEAFYAGAAGFLKGARKFAEDLKAGDDADGTAASELVLGDSGCSGTKKKPPDWPPKVTFKPFVAWLKKLSERKDGKPCGLCVGIVDFNKGVCCKWCWCGVTRSDAVDALDRLTRRYKSFCDSAADDGRHLMTGARIVTAALDACKMPALPAAECEEQWRKLAEAVKEPHGSSRKKGVVRAKHAKSAIKESLERIPTDEEWEALRDFCRDVFPLAFSGKVVVDR